LTTAPKSGTGGRIIFISATIHYTGLPLQTHAAVAKAGVDALSNAIAIELGPRGVTSNVIAPGPIGSTEGMERLARTSDAAAVASRVPVGRFGNVKEIADATVYLFSDTGNYVNGDTLVGT
jgi:peroxisomal 2,4-dienoyl-CoA reductase